MPNPSPAAIQALRDADQRWPGRSKASDGIVGDAAHQARKSDHNDGNAFDLTIPSAGTNGPNGDEIAEQALTDPRSTYVIWDRRIKSKARISEGWRAYDGANPHTKHVHVSISAAMRDDVSPWPWSPAFGETARDSLLSNPAIKFAAFTGGAVIGAAAAAQFIRALISK